MYILDAFWSIIPGNEAKAHAALVALAEQVEKEEPDTWMYLIHNPNLDPGVNTFPMPGPQQVAFVEGFKDRDAYHRHRNSPILKEFFAKNVFERVTDSPAEFAKLVAHDVGKWGTLIKQVGAKID